MSFTSKKISKLMLFCELPDDVLAHVFAVAEMLGCGALAATSRKLSLISRDAHVRARVLLMVCYLFI